MIPLTVIHFLFITFFNPSILNDKKKKGHAGKLMSLPGMAPFSGAVGVRCRRSATDAPAPIQASASACLLLLYIQINVSYVVLMACVA